MHKRERKSPWKNIPMLPFAGSEINEFVKLISSEMSIIDLDIDRGNIDELIVKLYEDFKI